MEPEIDKKSNDLINSMLFSDTSSMVKGGRYKQESNFNQFQKFKREEPVENSFKADISSTQLCQNKAKKKNLAPEEDDRIISYLDKMESARQKESLGNTLKQQEYNIKNEERLEKDPNLNKSPHTIEQVVSQFMGGFNSLQ